MPQPVPFWERSLRYRRLSAEARAAARQARDDYSKRSLTLLADGLQNLADVFSPSALYWNPAPANDNVTLPLREGRSTEAAQQRRRIGAGLTQGPYT